METFYLVLILSLITISTSTSDNEHKYTYNAAVVGVNSRIASLSIPRDEWLLKLTQKYNELVEKAYKESGDDLDIILFPESVIQRGASMDYSTTVPEPFSECICDSKSAKYEKYLIEMSCIAKRFDTTLVINLIEKYNCTMNKEYKNCPKSGIIYYNTNVAFDETGFVSGRYRKFNLFGELDHSPPPKPELITFTTKKGHVFGMFTCFDILFDNPAVTLVKTMGIRNVIFPNRWYSELPYLTALQVQQMWAQENNVTLIASGYNSPSSGSWGTGVFVGDKGPAYINLNYGEEPVVAVRQIPNIGIPNNPYSLSYYDTLDDEYDNHLTNFALMKDNAIPRYRSIVMRTDASDIVEEVCDGHSEILCCQFNISMSINKDNRTDKRSSYIYHLVAFNGVKSFSGYRYAGIESCGIIACLNNSLESCGQRYSNASTVSWDITFNKIQVSASFLAGDDRIQFPNSLQSNLSPILPENTTWTKEEYNGTVRRLHVLNIPVRKLLTFGIFGRVFSRDEDVAVYNHPDDKNNSETTNLNYALLLISLILVGIIGKM